MRLIDPIYRILFSEEKKWRDFYLEIKENIEKLGVDLPSSLFDVNQDKS